MKQTATGHFCISRYLTGTSLQVRLVWENIIKKREMWFASRKVLPALLSMPTLPPSHMSHQISWTKQIKVH